MFELENKEFNIVGFTVEILDIKPLCIFPIIALFLNVLLHSFKKENNVIYSIFSGVFFSPLV